MTKDEIIDMAKEAGLAIGVALDGSKSVGKHEDKSFAVNRLPLDDFVAFVKLVAEKAFKEGFFAGFEASGEGFNGEYPYSDRYIDIKTDEYVLNALKEAIEQA